MKYKRKKAKQIKTKGVLMPKSIECAHRKYEKVNIHKKICRVTEY